MGGTALDTGQGVHIQMKDVSVRAAGNLILENINLTVTPGEHVAIIGPSGAGKSTLAGLLLGWHRPALGQLHVNQRPLSGACITQLRQMTAWVDPAIQLWNQSFMDNLFYGTAAHIHMLPQVIEQADLLAILRKLPQGLQTPLGESGGLISGGEGQRVRLGRAMPRDKPRLVVLDEPFRGLGRDQQLH